jgi:hypothetical protein
MLCIHNSDDVPEKSPSSEEWQVRGDQRRSDSMFKYLPLDTWKLVLVEYFIII